MKSVYGHFKKIWFPFEWPFLSSRWEQTEIVSGKITNRQSIRRRRNNNNRRVLDDAVIKIKLIGLVVCAFPYGNFRRRWLYSRRGVLCVIAYNALFILHSPSTPLFRIHARTYIRGNPLLLSSLLFMNLSGPDMYGPIVGFNGYAFGSAIVIFNSFLLLFIYICDVWSINRLQIFMHFRDAEMHKMWLLWGIRNI